MSQAGQRAVDRIDVAYVANLARLKLSADETSMFQNQLQDIVGYVRKVMELDVTGVEPMAHGVPMQNVLRRDEARDGLTIESVLLNAPAKRDDQFVVPKIVE